MMSDRDHNAEHESNRPNAARMYDYYLGGSSNFEIDRRTAEELLAKTPQIRDGARANRGFLVRAVRYCLDQGVRQFLDLGSGVPTVGNVHEIAQAHDPQARVVYVDHESIAVAHGRRMLADNSRAAVVQADLCDVDLVLDSPGVTELIDFDEPVAVLAVAVLHFLTDERIATAIPQYRAACRGGGYLVLSHATCADETIDMEHIKAAYRNASSPIHLRDRQEFTDLFGGLELVEPGVVYAPEWHAEWPVDDPQGSGFFGAVATLG